MSNNQMETPKEGQSPEDNIRFLGLEEEQPQEPEKQPEVNQQETEQPQQPEPQPSEEQQPETPVGQSLIAGKFKSVEDMEKSYKELEKKLTQLAREKKQLEQSYQVLAQQQPKTQPTSQVDEQKFLDQFLNQPASTVEGLVEEKLGRLRKEIIAERKIAEKEQEYRKLLGNTFDKVKPIVDQYVNYYKQNYLDTLVDGSGYDFAVSTAVGQLAIKNNLTPPAQPSPVETARPTATKSYSREIVELARKFNRKPEELEQELEAIEQGRPFDLETLSPKEV